MAPPVGSTRFRGQCYFSTASNALLNALSSATVSYWVQFNSLGGLGASAGVPVVAKGSGANGLLQLPASPTQSGNFLAELYGAASTNINAYYPVQIGIPYFVTISWASGSQQIVVSGCPVISGTVAQLTGSYTGALSIGPSAVNPVDFQLADLAIWDGFAADLNDHLNLWNKVYTPLTLVADVGGLVTPATAWYSMGGVTLGAQPAVGDAGLNDATGNGYSVTTTGGTATNAIYAAALAQTPPLSTSAYVTKSGKVAMFFPVAAVPAVNGYYPPQQVISCPGLTGITWNGKAIQADGPIWSSTRFFYPFVGYRLQCGSVQSIGIQNGGTASYTAPVAVWFGDGGGTSLMLGTPVLAQGIIAYTVTPSTGWTGATAPGISQSGGTYTQGPVPAVVYNQAAGTVKVIPIVGGLPGCGEGVTVSPTFTLSGGSQSAIVTPILGNYIQSVPVTSSSADFTSQPTIVVSDTGSGTGAGAVLLAVMSGVTSIADTLAYTAPLNWMVAAAYQTSEPSGGVAGPIMGGAPAATAAALENFFGVVEGQAGNLAGFPTARTMGLGVNMGASVTGPSSPNSPMRNYAKKAGNGWTVAGGTVTTLWDGTPVSWTPKGNTIYTTFYQGSDGNPVDSKGTPMLTGVWTVVADDLGPANSPSKSATTFKLNVFATTLGTCVQLGSTVISGTTVTQQYTVSYVSNPTAWDLELTFLASHPDGIWYLQNLTIIPPSNSGTANATTEAPALGGDQNVLGWLTTPRMQTPAVLRWMDSMNSYGGTSNVVDVGDLLPASAFAWSAAGAIPWGTPPYGQPPHSAQDAGGNWNLSGRIIFTGFQCYNTDPSKGPIASGGDGTYADVSPNFYSSQWGLTGTDSLGPYLTLPPTDNGTFLYGANNFPNQYLALELISSAPHGLRSGQIVNFILPAGAISIRVVGMGNVVWTSNGVFETGVYVTGPDKLVVGVYVNGPGTTIQRVNEGNFVPFTNYTAALVYGTMQQPYGPSVPVEFISTFATELGSDPWFTLPVFSSLACSAEMARRAATTLGPGRKCYVEWGNEVWNTSFAGYFYCQTFGSLLPSLPSGTKIGNYYTTDGVSTLGRNKFFAIWSGAHHDLWDAAFTAAGHPAGTVVRLLGSSFADPGNTQTNLGYATQFGVPVDMVHVAPYYYMYGDDPVVNAFNPAGAAVMPLAGPGVTQAGNWPMDAVLDTIKHAMFYYLYYWPTYSQHQAATSAGGGQPEFAAIVAGGSSGASTAGGYYYGYYTFVDSTGRETTVGNSQSVPINVGAGFAVVVTLPTLPVGYSGMNVYLTPANALPGSEVKVNGGTLVTGTTYTQSAAVPATGGTAPPVTNQVPLPRGEPKLISYETGPSSLLPYRMQRVSRMARDAFYHRTVYDAMTVMFGALQTGNPAVPNSGMVIATYFELCNSWTNEGGVDGVYAMAVSTSQQPGYGSSNQFAMLQGGSPGDNTAHDRFNQVPILQAARDWWDGGTSPISYTLSGPTSGYVGSPYPFEVYPSSTVASDTLTPSDSPSGGTFFPATLVIVDDLAPVAFTYTATTAGTKTISVSSLQGYPLDAPVVFVAAADTGGGSAAGSALLELLMR